MGARLGTGRGCEKGGCEKGGYKKILRDAGSRSIWSGGYVSKGGSWAGNLTDIYVSILHLVNETVKGIKT